jgi:hypothetical protein
MNGFQHGGAILGDPDYPVVGDWTDIFEGLFLTPASLYSQAMTAGRVDGEEWPEGQALLDAHAFTFPPGYASLRHLLIALPKVV